MLPGQALPLFLNRAEYAWVFYVQSNTPSIQRSLKPLSLFNKYYFHIYREYKYES